MRLGTQTNSLVNSILASATNGQPEPVVGMGATVLCWTDRHAGTIFRVFKINNLKAVEIRYDETQRTDKNGMSESQEYSYKTCVNGARSYFAFKDGRWREAHKDDDGKFRIARKGDGHGLQIGVRREYHDFSF